MENKSNEATLLRPKGDRVIDAAVVSVDLSAYTKQIKEESAWKKSDRNAITVFKTGYLRQVLVALREGAEMQKNDTDGIISIQLLEGNVDFNAGEQNIQLSKNQLVTLHENIAYYLKAKAESVFLLTLVAHNLQGDVL